MQLFRNETYSILYTCVLTDDKLLHYTISGNIN